MYGFKEIDPEGLKSLQDGEKAVVVDVRSEAEVQRGMIRGSVHIPLHMLPIRLGELDPSVPVVFYCQTGARSGQAAAFAVSRGLRDAYNLRGGIVVWAREGNSLAYPVPTR